MLQLHEVWVAQKLGINDPIQDDVEDLLTIIRFFLQGEVPRSGKHRVAKLTEFESDTVRCWVAEACDEDGESFECGRHVDGREVVIGLGVLHQESQDSDELNKVALVSLNVFPVVVLEI